MTDLPVVQDPIPLEVPPEESDSGHYTVVEAPVSPPPIPEVLPGGVEDF